MFVIAGLVSVGAGVYFNALASGAKRREKSSCKSSDKMVT